MEYKQNMTHDDYMQLIKEPAINQIDYLIQDMIVYANKDIVSDEVADTITCWRYILMQISNKHEI